MRPGKWLCHAGTRCRGRRTARRCTGGSRAGWVRRRARRCVRSRDPEMAESPSARLHPRGSAASATSSSTSAARSRPQRGEAQGIQTEAEDRRLRRAWSPTAAATRSRAKRLSVTVSSRAVSLQRCGSSTPTDTSPRAHRWRSRRCSAGREHITPRTDGAGPGDRGPQLSRGRAARAPAARPSTAFSTAEGINCRSAEGVLGDADRDHIDTMVLYPSFGLVHADARRPDFAAGFARLYNEWIADYCRPIRRPAARHRGHADRARRRRDRHHARGKGSRPGRDATSRPR